MNRIDEDPAAEALEEVASAAEEVADEQRELARQARAIGRSRRAGTSWIDLVSSGLVSTLIRPLRASARRIGRVATTLQVGLARSLAKEGLTTRKIGEHLDVSHQHVSALMADKEPQEPPLNA